MYHPDTFTANSIFNATKQTRDHISKITFIKNQA